MPTQLLTVNAITKGFTANQVPIVKNISFSVYPGEIFAPLGASDRVEIDGADGDQWLITAFPGFH